jgi:hypothetical protein
VDNIIDSKHDVLSRYTIVACAQDSVLDENDELASTFMWVVYHNDSTHLFVSRVDHMSGEVRVHTQWPYASAKEYAEAFRQAMAILYERSTGFDLASAAPRS